MLQQIGIKTFFPELIESWMLWIYDCSIHLKYVNRSSVHCKSNPKTTFRTGFWGLQTDRAIPETSDLTNILSERQWGTRVDQNIQWQRQTLKIKTTFVFSLFDTHKSANTILGMFHQSNFVNQRITYLQKMYTQ